MNKRAVILLVICFVLAAATVTLRYIESEKEKIKAQFVPPPRVEPERVRSFTTTVYLPEETAEEQLAAQTPEINGTLPPEEMQDTSRDEMPKRRSSQRMERIEQKKALEPLVREEEDVTEREVLPEEPLVTPLEDDVPDDRDRLAEEEPDAEPEEDADDEQDVPDDESAIEADTEDEEDVPPEELGEEEELEEEGELEEMEEGEYVEGEEEGELFEEVLEDQEDEILGEEEVIPFEEEEFPSGEEEVLEEEGFLEEEE